MTEHCATSSYSSSYLGIGSHACPLCRQGGQRRSQRQGAACEPQRLRLLRARRPAGQRRRVPRQPERRRARRRCAMRPLRDILVHALRVCVFARLAGWLNRLFRLDRRSDSEPDRHGERRGLRGDRARGPRRRRQPKLHAAHGPSGRRLQILRRVLWVPLSLSSSFFSAAVAVAEAVVPADTDPAQCEQDCDADPECRAWTYVGKSSDDEDGDGDDGSTERGYPVPRCCLKNDSHVRPRPAAQVRFLTENSRRFSTICR